MRAFIVLCLLAAACADHLGYNYQHVSHSSNSVPNFTKIQGGADFAAGSSSEPSSQGVANYNAGSNAAPSYSDSQGANDYTDGSNFAPQVDFSQASHDNDAYAPQADVEKEFFTYTANEEDFSEPAASNQLSNSLQQGLRVIFIKGPENNGLENSALALAKQGSEQKTAIYVLHKEADLSALANNLNSDNKISNIKPEVYFVNYRNPEEAANAQKAIQGQYDSLGGSSQSHDGGVAPVLNFASEAPVASHGSDGSHGVGYLGAGSLGAVFFGSQDSVSNAGSSYPSAGADVAAPGPSYLPASVFRRLRL